MIHRDIRSSHCGSIPYPRAHYTHALHSILTGKHRRNRPRSTFSQQIYPCLGSIMLAYSDKHLQNTRNGGRVEYSLTSLLVSTGPLSIPSIAGIRTPSSKDVIEVRDCTDANDQGRHEQTGERNALHVASFPSSFLWDNEKDRDKYWTGQRVIICEVHSVGRMSG